MNVLVIARWTVQEAFGRRWIQAGAALGLVFVSLFTLGFSFLHARALREIAARPDSERLLLLFAGGSAYAVLGLYAVHFLGSFMALLLATGSIAAEVESGLALAILARPVRPSTLNLQPSTRQ
jgi:ABC-type transport system involved in multi-copper enzyme maturation permease subunit